MAEFGDFSAGGTLVRAHEQRAAVEERCERGRIARQDVEAVLSEPQVANDFRPEEADDIGGDGNFEAGPEFFRDGATAEDVAAFQHADFLARPGEVCRGDEAVVAAADDKAVEMLTHW